MANLAEPHFCRGGDCHKDAITREKAVAMSEQERAELHLIQSGIYYRSARWQGLLDKL